MGSKFEHLLKHVGKKLVLRHAVLGLDNAMMAIFQWLNLPMDICCIPKKLIKQTLFIIILLL